MIEPTYVPVSQFKNKYYTSSARLQATKMQIREESLCDITSGMALRQGSSQLIICYRVPMDSDPFSRYGLMP